MEIVRRVHEAWARGDFSQVDVFDCDVEFETVPGVGHGIYHGLEEMGRAWGDILRSYGRFRAEFEEIIDAGDKVLVLTVPVMQLRDSAAEVKQKTAAVWTLRDRKVIRLALHNDRADAYREAGIDDARPS